MKSIISVVFIFLFFISCAENALNSNELNSNVVSNFGSSSDFSLVTWNVEYFPKHVSTVNIMAEIIVDLNVDILGLQEITSTPYLNQLINKINNLDSLNHWVGFRSDNGEYQELAYIINTSSVTIIDAPYSILNNYYHYFAYREPYVVRVSFMNNAINIINIHYKCCGDGNLELDYNDEEYRRQQASVLLKNYIDSNFSSDDNVIVIGDMNDRLNDAIDDNVFLNFIQDDTKYKFVDMEIAYGSSTNWSYPDWPSHLDHILITNELFDEFANPGSSILTLRLEDYFSGGWGEYNYFISDHRPVGLRLIF